MRARRSVVSFLLGAFCSCLIFAQNHETPDLSGRWELNLAKGKLSKKAKFGSEKLLIKQDGPNLEFDYDSDGKRSVAVYVSDKKDKVLREVPAAGSAIVAKAYWKGASLIIQTKAVFKMSFAAEMMNTKDTGTLSEDGLVLADKDASDDGSFMKVYDKRN